jgi:hypothetical protein
MACDFSQAILVFDLLSLAGSYRLLQISLNIFYILKAY